MKININARFLSGILFLLQSSRFYGKIYPSTPKEKRNAKKNIKEWLRNIRKSQNEIGQIPGIIPTYDWGYQWGHGPAWDSVLVELPYRVYQYENDTDIIYENAAFIFKYVQYLSKKISHKNHALNSVFWLLCCGH